MLLIVRPLLHCPSLPQAGFYRRHRSRGLSFGYGTLSPVSSFVSCGEEWTKHGFMGLRFEGMKLKFAYGVIRVQSISSISPTTMRKGTGQGWAHITCIRRNRLHGLIPFLSSNRHSSLTPLSPFIKLPKYFRSEWSSASYRLPGPTAHIALSSALGSPGDNPPSIDAGETEKCVVGWIQVPVKVRRRRTIVPGTQQQRYPSSSVKGKGRARSSLDKVRVEEEFVEEEVLQYQLLALTYSGCWYRLSMPSTSSGEVVSSMVGRKASPVPSVSLAAGGGSTPRDIQYPHRAPPTSPSVTSVSTSPPSHSSSASSHRASSAKGRKAEGEVDSERNGRECVLEEFRRFGRWDGWA